MDLGLRDRVYLVAGGSRGLGFAAAQADVAAWIVAAGDIGGHALLALEHGIAIHRASLGWVGSAMGALGETS